MCGATFLFCASAASELHNGQRVDDVRAVRGKRLLSRAVFARMNTVVDVVDVVRRTVRGGCEES